MQYKRFEDHYLVCLQPGDEIIGSLKQMCKKENIRCGHISGIGAVDHVDIGWYECSKSIYHTQEFNDEYEILSLSGNVSLLDDEQYIHLHIMLAGKDFTAFGGHLNSGRISATCEIIVDKISHTMHRRKDEKTGLNVLWIDEYISRSV